MNEVVMIVILTWVSFFSGMIILFAIGRGLFWTYIQAFITGRILLKIHLNKGGAAYKIGMPVPGGSMVSATMNGRKDLRYWSVDSRAVVRAARVRWMDVTENDTAPFIFSKVVAQKETIEVDDKDEKTGELIKKKIEVVAYRLFEGWNDNAIVRQLYNWALMRPRRKLPGLGIDLRAVLIILAVIAGIVIFVGQLKSGGAPSNIIG